MVQQGSVRVVRAAAVRGGLWWRADGKVDVMRLRGFGGGQISQADILFETLSHRSMAGAGKVPSEPLHQLLFRGCLPVMPVNFLPPA
jgi:hypothetical protein